MRKLILASAAAALMASLAACGESAADKTAEVQADQLEAQAAATPNEQEEKNLNARLTTQLKKIPTANYQLNIFDGLAEDLKRIKETLEGVEINTLTPVEALMKLNELKGIVRTNG